MRDNEGSRMQIYTDLEWSYIELANALIRGYKANKGVSGYLDDYWRGKAIVDDVHKGKFRSSSNLEQPIIFGGLRR